MKFKVLIAVVHCLREPWISIFEKGTNVTWLQMELPENIDIVHFHGRPLSKLGWHLDRAHEWLRWKNRWVAIIQKVIDFVLGMPFLLYVPSFTKSRKISTKRKVIQINIADSYRLLRWKDLGVLKYFLENSDADFLYMTTNNSYIRPNKLNERIAHLELSELYAGVKPYEGANFAAGNSRLLSRKVVEKFLKNRSKFKVTKIEDSAMGDLALQLGVSFTPLESCLASSVNEVKLLSKSELMQNFHFRVKSGSLSERKDDLLMGLLHDRIINLEVDNGRS